jgi:hypothetical protein
LGDAKKSGTDGYDVFDASLDGYYPRTKVKIMTIKQAVIQAAKMN